jgi:hypothetical protein
MPADRRREVTQFRTAAAPSSVGHLVCRALCLKGTFRQIPEGMKGSFTRTYGVKVPFMRNPPIYSADVQADGHTVEVER